MLTDQTLQYRIHPEIGDAKREVPGGFPHKTQIQQEGKQFGGKSGHAEACNTEYLAQPQLEEKGKEQCFGKIENVCVLVRAYDFKVTDCSDIDYKSVFRKSDTGTVNDLTKIQYFSGIKELKIFSKNVNTLENRDNINIGNNSTSKIILPLGPYKNTNSSYINAPKLGYRISFDLKTSGYFKYDENKSSNRKIRITPSYYYISKDGSKYIENVTLYYKDSDGILLIYQV